MNQLIVLAPLFFHGTKQAQVQELGHNALHFILFVPQLLGYPFDGAGDHHFGG